MRVVVDTNVLVSGLLDRPFMELAQAAPPGTVLVSGDQDIHAVAGAQFRAMTPARFVAEFIADKAR